MCVLSKHSTHSWVHNELQAAALLRGTGEIPQDGIQQNPWCINTESTVWIEYFHTLTQSSLTLLSICNHPLHQRKCANVLSGNTTPLRQQSQQHRSFFCSNKIFVTFFATDAKPHLPRAGPSLSSCGWGCCTWPRRRPFSSGCPGRLVWPNVGESSYEPSANTHTHAHETLASC